MVESTRDIGDKRLIWSEPRLMEISVKVTSNSMHKPGIHDDGIGMSNGDAGGDAGPAGSI